ncbi:MAG: DUF1801 domain-containing protein [Dehalococcoidia bacterium]
MNEIDAYLAALPPTRRETLETLRAQLHAILPGATEVISYRLPTLRYRNRMIVSFGASGSHCALYVLSNTLLEPFREQLRGFQTGKGTVRFSPEHPIRPALVEALVRAKMVEARVD